VRGFWAGRRAPGDSPAEMARALEIALDSIRTDRVRTRAAVVALAIAMVITVCLTTLVERGRASTIRTLERAGLKNLYMVGGPGSPPGPSPGSPRPMWPGRAL